MDADLSFDEALNRVRSSVLEAYARQEAPFDFLATQLAEEHGLDAASFAEVVFVLQNAFRAPLNMPGLEVRPFPAVESQPGIPINSTSLTFTLAETQSGLSIGCRYKKRLFKGSAFSNWIASYKTILARVVANPEISLGRLADRAK